MPSADALLKQASSTLSGSRGRRNRLSLEGEDAHPHSRRRRDEWPGPLTPRASTDTKVSGQRSVVHDPSQWSSIRGRPQLSEAAQVLVVRASLAFHTAHPAAARRHRCSLGIGFCTVPASANQYPCKRAKQIALRRVSLRCERNQQQHSASRHWQTAAASRHWQQCKAPLALCDLAPRLLLRTAQFIWISPQPLPPTSCLHQKESLLARRGRWSPGTAPEAPSAVQDEARRT